MNIYKINLVENWHANFFGTDVREASYKQHSGCRHEALSRMSTFNGHNKVLSEFSIFFYEALLKHLGGTVELVPILTAKQNTRDRKP
jgi:hypothetical protein